MAARTNLAFIRAFVAKSSGIATAESSLTIYAWLMARIRPVECGCTHPHKNLFRAGERIRGAAQLENVRPPGAAMVMACIFQINKINQLNKLNRR